MKIAPHSAATFHLLPPITKTRQRVITASLAMIIDRRAQRLSHDEKLLVRDSKTPLWGDKQRYHDSEGRGSPDEPPH